MKTFQNPTLILGLLLALPLHAQTTTTDDFTNSSKWTVVRVSSAATTLAVANGRMNYTTSSSAASGAIATWTGPKLPTNQDWSLAADAHIDAFAMSSYGQFVDVFLGVGRTSDVLNTNVLLEFDRGNWGAGLGYDIGDDITVSGSDVTGILNEYNLTSPDVSLRMDYNATDRTLTYYFDSNGATGGYSWVTKGTLPLGPTFDSLGISPTETFTVMLVGSSELQTVASGTAYLSNLRAHVNQSPVVMTGNASGITAHSAIINGIVTPNGLSTTAQFEYGLTSSYGSIASVTLSPNSGTTPQNVSASLTGLQTGQIYHYRLIASNDGGTKQGQDMTFLANFPGPEIVVENSSGASLYDGGESFNYGIVSLGSNVLKTFTIRNLGSENLTGLSIAIDGGDFADFTVGAIGSTTLVTGASTTFTVAFAPSAAGIRRASIHISSNDGDESPFDIRLDGASGVQGAAKYAGTYSGTCSGDRNGTWTMKVDIQGHLTVDTNFSASYPYGIESFTTYGSVESNGTFVNYVSSNDYFWTGQIDGFGNATGSWYRSGTPWDGTFVGNQITSGAPEIEVEDSVGGNLQFNKTLGFGSLIIGTSSQFLLTIRNTGYFNLNQLTVFKDGPGAESYALGAIDKTSLAPGESTTFPVTFTPLVDYPGVPTIHITSNDFYDGLYNIKLLGEGTSSFSFGYTVFGGKATITSASNGMGGMVEIPATISGFPVVNIGDDILFGAAPFHGKAMVTGVIIPSSVKSIGWLSFADCTRLTSVTIPSGVTTIGDSAFAGCRSLPRVTIPSSVTAIGSSAFRSCISLTSVTIPNSVTNVGDGAFSECDGLMEIVVDPTNQHYIDLDGILFKKNQPCLVQYPGGKIGHYTISNNTTTIQNNAFSGCKGLTSVTIPNGVTSIGDGAFSGCTGLTSVTIPSSVISIGIHAFSGCTGLTAITLQDGIETIGEGMFWDCTGLANVTIPSSVKSIGASAFYGCKSLTNISIPSSVTMMGDGVFSECSGLTDFSLSSSVTSIGAYTFSGCGSLTSVTIPSSVTSIGRDAFSICKGLTNITLPNSVTIIGSFAFMGCDSLTHVSIPSSVTSLEYGAFQSCDRLTKAFFLGNAPSMGDYVFSFVPSDFIIYYLSGRSGFSMPTWKGYSSGIAAGVMPSVVSATSNNITNTAATLGGNVASNGGGTIVARGVVCAPTAVNSNPMVGGTGVINVTSAGETGVFTVNVGNLTVGVSYTFAAYATNSIGTSYSSPATFTTIAVPPTATSPSSANVTSTTATLGGNITSDGGAAIAVRGVVYAPTAINSSPQLGGTGVINVTSAGNTGVFTINVSSLMSGTAYSFAAYATNGAGTGYSSTGGFTTTLPAPEIVVEQPANTNLPNGGSKNFGPVSVGSSTSLTFTIKNIGTANLTGLVIGKDGANAGDFTVGSLAATTVAAGASTTFTVTFAPGAAGSRSAAIHIASNDADENPLDINLSGSGVDPSQTVAAAIDLPAAQITNGGQAPWAWQSTTTHDGADAAKSGAITHSRTSEMSVTVTGPGTLSFWWKVSSESGCDFLRFYIDGEEQSGKISGTVDWTQKSFSLTTGNHTLKWAYSKDSSVSSGSDCGWVDQVVLPVTAPATPSDTWLLANGLPADTNLLSDPNGNGVSLLMAYAFNLNPAHNLSGSMPRPVVTADRMSFTFYAGNADVTYLVETSTDLSVWSTAGITLSSADANGLRTATFLMAGPTRFMRLRPVIMGSAYGPWRAAGFSAADLANAEVSGDLADPDRDSIPNLLEYAMAGQPKGSDVNCAPTAGYDGGYLTLTYRQSKSATDIAFMPQASANPANGTWSAAGLVETGRVDHGTYWLVTVRDAVPIATAPRRFMRLTVGN